MKLKHSEGIAGEAMISLSQEHEVGVQFEFLGSMTTVTNI